MAMKKIRRPEVNQQNRAAGHVAKRILLNRDKVDIEEALLKAQAKKAAGKAWHQKVDNDTFSMVQRQLMAQQPTTQPAPDNGSGTQLTPAPATLPQSVADAAVDSIMNAAEVDRVPARKDFASSIKDSVSSLRKLAEDLDREVDLAQNDPKWKALSVGERIKRLNGMADALNKIVLAERNYITPIPLDKGGGRDKGQSPQIHLHYNMPEDDSDLRTRLDELDKILGRAPGMIPPPPPGHTQRILIETRPTTFPNSQPLLPTAKEALDYARGHSLTSGQPESVEALEEVSPGPTTAGIPGEEGNQL